MPSQCMDVQNDATIATPNFHIEIIFTLKEAHPPAHQQRQMTAKLAVYRPQSRARSENLYMMPIDPQTKNCCSSNPSPAKTPPNPYQMHSMQKPPQQLYPKRPVQSFGGKSWGVPAHGWVLPRPVMTKQLLLQQQPHAWQTPLSLLWCAAAGSLSSNRA